MEHVTYNLDDKLMSLLGSKELLEQWWNSSNSYFHGDTPEQIWRSNPQKVIQYVDQFCYGDYA